MRLCDFRTNGPAICCAIRLPDEVVQSNGRAAGPVSLEGTDSQPVRLGWANCWAFGPLPATNFVSLTNVALGRR